MASPFEQSTAAGLMSVEDARPDDRRKQDPRKRPIRLTKQRFVIIGGTFPADTVKFCDREEMNMSKTGSHT
jgi:hypothetical protein